MKKLVFALTASIGLIFMTGFSNNDSQPKENNSKSAKIGFLHHSTGESVWIGNTPKLLFKALGKSDVKTWLTDYNKSNKTSYEIEHIYFPTGKNYEWKNYPYDYYNIWVKHAGDSPYRDEPTLEMLTKKYDVIIWKHCYPVGKIQPDTGNPDVESEEKRLENYKLQYLKLREKMRSFPDKKFIVWTGAALVKNNTTPEEAQRTRQFFDWVKSEWDESGDNVFLWDFYQLETEGGPYLKEENGMSLTDSHPRPEFGGKVAPLFAQRIVDVIEGRGDSTPLTGLKATQ